MPLEVYQTEATLCVKGKSAANTALTVTLPDPGTSLTIVVDSILITRGSTAALVGSAVLDITSTNLQGWGISVGNAMLIGATQKDVEMTGLNLRATAAHTACTIVFPAAGAAVISSIAVTYHTEINL